jgi:hypothetical protein
MPTHRKEQAVKVIRTHLPSPAMIVACASLVVALGGVSYAAVVLPNNSVGAAQLKKNAVTSAKLRKSAVTSLQVKDHSLLAKDFKAGQLPAGPKGDTGATGPKGDTGATGAKGDKGDPGATNVTRRTASGPAVGAGGFSNATASCQAGETLVGGGAIYNSVPPADPTLTWSGPDLNSASSWRASFRNDGPGGSMTAFAYAFCAAP